MKIIYYYLSTVQDNILDLFNFLINACFKPKLKISYNNHNDIARPY